METRKHERVAVMVIGLKCVSVQGNGKCKGPEAWLSCSREAGGGQCRDLWAKLRPESKIPFGLSKMYL